MDITVDGIGRSASGCAGGDCSRIMDSMNFEECKWAQVAEWGTLSMDGPIAALIVYDELRFALYDACVAMRPDSE